jgi:uncharacterized membrane protein HdeD (DUF308 family)
MRGTEFLTNIKAAAMVLAFVMLIAGLTFLFLRARAGERSAQMFGLVLLVPTVLALAVTDAVSKDMLGVLLGGVAGYVFGRSA